MSQLFRQLILMTQSLSPLPDHVDRLLSLRLFFTDSTPDDYQPPGFRASNITESARFITKFQNDRPHDQEIGSINTGFHACTLKITTIGDLDHDSEIHRKPTVKYWDAEHNAKVACQRAEGDIQHLKGDLQIPPALEIKALGLEYDRAPVRLRSLESTQVMTQSQQASQPEAMEWTQASQTRNSSQIPATDHTIDTKRDGPHSSQDDEVSCECGDSTDEGIMMQCEKCQKWSHCSCYACSLPMMYTDTRATETPLRKASYIPVSLV